MTANCLPNENRHSKTLKGYHLEVEGDNLSRYLKKSANFQGRVLLGLGFSMDSKL